MTKSILNRSLSYGKSKSKHEIKFLKNEGDRAIVRKDIFGAALSVMLQFAIESADSKGKLDEK